MISTDVRREDPALLTGYEIEDLHRCQFTEKYFVFCRLILLACIVTSPVKV
jgi:hypothetical protein